MMSSDPDRPKKAPRKHVTTACVPCRESKIRCDGASPNCQNCQRKGKECKYQHGDDKRKVSLRAATELFSARIDQLCQFIHDQGLEPPPMNPEDEAGMNRVLDTLQIPRGFKKNADNLESNPNQPTGAQDAKESNVPPTCATYERQVRPAAETATPDTSSSQEAVPGQQFAPPMEPWNAFGVPRGASDNQNFVHSGFTLPTAESLDTLYADINGIPGVPANTNFSPDSLQFGVDMTQHPGVLLSQALNDKEDNSDSGEEDEAENDVIEQLSHRIGTLKIAGDGHLRFYGATSNLNLVDVSATQQRQRPDARTVRHDGQDILNHLRVGQPVDQALEDHLVELYFTWQNPSIYVVDKEMFMTARSKWRNEYDDTPFYSEVLTNAMCAIGSAFEARYHPTFITFPKSLAEFFADRAKALLEIELDSPCVATVQALVILSCHEGASNRDARGWLYSGMSMRLAFDLGLHLDMTPYVNQGDVSPAEADVRRAAFWGSYLADHFWGFYLGRPFRINAGDITAPKPASALGPEKQGTWHPYGLQTNSEVLRGGLKNPLELICRQFVVLWEMISPAGPILYGCSDISRHDLQRLCYQVTEDLFAWKANLPSVLEIDLDDDRTPKLPHLLMLHMQYHQIVIFFHRPWVSKNYIQPRSPRQGPGYHHARRMCVESATAIARLLHLYEKHYTFRRMNNQAVAIIFSAALMLLFFTVSSTHLAPGKAGDNQQPGNAEMAAYLNLCFRALDELGQSFENAKRTRDFLVALQRRWQAHIRRSGSAAKRQSSSTNLQSQQAPSLPSNQHNPGQGAARKKSRLNASSNPPSHHPQNKVSSSSSATIPNSSLQSSQPLPSNHQQQQHFPPYQEQQFQPGTLDWIRNSDLHLLSEDPDATDTGANDITQASSPPFPGDSGVLSDIREIEAWWASPTADPGMGGSGYNG